MIPGVQAVAIFAPDANGDVTPLSYFTSGYSAFNIALDGHDNMYVTNVGYDDPPFIQIFAAGTIGNKGRLLRQIRRPKNEVDLARGHSRSLT